MGISHLVVESDRLLLVEALQQNAMLNPMLGNLFSEVQRLSSLFHNVSFTYVYREGNIVTHSLARYAWKEENMKMYVVR